MGTYVDEKTARQAEKNGKMIGRTRPDEETKWSWWEVFKCGAEIIACVCTSEMGVCGGEKITEDELHMYVDDVEAARELLLSDAKDITDESLPSTQ